MPALKICAVRGCGRKTATRYCPEHDADHRARENAYKNSRPLREIYDSPRWRKVRQVALHRDGHQCVVCGTSNRLSVHHIVPALTCADPFDVDNLTTVCRVHHGAVDGVRSHG